MTFDAPWMLAGLLGVGVVVWLHLRTPRDRVLVFPAVSLLARAARKQAPRLRIRRALLLATRILAVAAVALAMAKPGIDIARPGGLRAGTAIAQVIVVDDSMSMRRRLADGTTAFDTAKKLALAEVGRLRPGDAAAIVLSGYPVRTPLLEPLFDLDKVAATLRSLAPTYRSGNIEIALEAASRLLEDSPLAGREIVLVTDLSEGGFAERALPRLRDLGIGFRVVSAGGGAGAENASLDRVRIEPAGEGTAREVVVEATVTNHGTRALSGIDVIFELDGVEEARGALDVPAKGQSTKRFHHRFAEDGVRRGLVRIRADGLPEDGVRHFTYNIRPSLKALVIDGDYRPGSYRDEAFYLMRALETPTPRELPIAATAVDMASAAAGTVAGNDVVLIVGVDELPPSLAERLVAFARAGGGIIAAPGATGGRLSSLAAILPAEVRSASAARKGEKPKRIGAVNRAHPIFAAFGDGAIGLEETHIETHLLVEPDTSIDRTVIAELEDGAPLLIERRIGRGGVLLLTTTLDRDWTDLPIRPGYLPFVQRAVRYIGRRLGERTSERVLVGDRTDLEVSPGMSRLLVVDPNGKETSFSSKDLEGRSKIAFLGTETPGSYRVFADLPDQGGITELTGLEFSVETDPREAVLGPAVRPETLSTKTGDGVAASGPLELAGRFPTWPYLLAAAAILLAIEALLAGLGHRRSHSRS